MELVEYKKEDAEYIVNWLDSEKTFYKWSADRINKFPLLASDLNKFYDALSENTRFIPLTFVEDNIPVGHLIIRYPDMNNEKLVRLGFIIISPDLRGKGYGKKMLSLAINYAKIILRAKTITLGVFTNNEKALYCYKAVGFKSMGEIEKYSTALGEWDCVEMEMEL